MLAASGAHELRNEYCLQIVGEVALRPEGNANPDLPTGEIEVVTTRLDAGGSDRRPFQIDDWASVGEETRLKYRYLDLRRPGPAAAIRLRSEVNRVARAVLAIGVRRGRDADAHALDAGGGAGLPGTGAAQARLLVRIAAEPATVQAAADGGWSGSGTTRSPGAIGTRICADRQPEFTQLDIEMSFLSTRTMSSSHERLITEIWN